jgi:phage terminase large subunit-like protein
MKIHDYLRNLPKEVIADLTTQEGRIRQTRHDPLLFAIIYLPHHLTSDSGSMSLSAFHLELIEWAKSWTLPVTKPREFRDSFIAPRNGGKSTWLFLLLPMWGAAHGHIKFLAAFSDSASQAEDHLQSFKDELDANEALTRDYVDLCTPLMGTQVKRYVAQSSSQIRQANGFTFMAKGIDAKTLGMKVGRQRPDLLLFDDIEPPESTYSAIEAERRLSTVLQAAFPLNIYARVAIVGTTTMPGSVIDQLRTVGELEREWLKDRESKGSFSLNGNEELNSAEKSGTNEFLSELPISTPFKNTDSPKYWAYEDRDFSESIDPELRWVIDSKVRVHYFPAVITNEDGSEESLWPEFWPLDDLNSIRHTRDFAMNYMNRPVSLSADYWQNDDINVTQAVKYRNTILSLDPAVKTAKKNDYTGIAILSRGEDDKIYVRHAEGVKIAPGPELQKYVSELCERFSVGLVYVETNQGGDVWKSVLDGVPAKYRGIHNTEKKELRATKALDFYRKKMVVHTGHFDTLLTQMYAYPKVKNDDVLDAVVSGVLYFLGKPQGKATVKRTSYI